GGVTHGFLWQNGQPMTDLGTLAGSAGTSYATAINDSGEIVGYSFPTTNFSIGTPTQAVLWQVGQNGQYGITNLGAEGGSIGSQANAIDDAGQVVGEA